MDESDTAFYDYNKRELESLDLGRVAAAARRLAEVEPKLYRDDISRRLATVLEQGEPEAAAAAARALRVWAVDRQAAGELAAATARRNYEAGEHPKPDIVGLAVATGTRAILPVLDELWAADPPRWESLYGDFGPEIEPALLARIPGASEGVRQSAVRLLGRVGTAASLPVLEDLSEETAAMDVTAQIDQARKAIVERAAAE